MIDFEKLKLVYKVGRNIGLQDAQVVLKAAQAQSFAPGEYLIQAGSTQNRTFLIRKGLVRSFTITEKGDEVTTLLRWEHQFVVNHEYLLLGEPSTLYFQALEPTDVFSMDFDVLDAIVSKHPKLEANRKLVFRQVMRQALHRIDSFVLMTPEERYLDFIQQNPDIVNRVQDKYIAHVLGITPVSLSRIKKRIAMKGR